MKTVPNEQIRIPNRSQTYPKIRVNRSVASESLARSNPIECFLLQVFAPWTNLVDINEVHETSA